MPNQNIIIMLIAMMRSLFHEEFEVQSLTADLLDDDPTAAAQAAQALGDLGNQMAVAPLLEMLPITAGELKRADPAQRSDLIDLRQDVVRALGKLEDERAVEPLIAVMHHDKDRGVRYEAATALQRIGTPTATKAARQWQQSNSP